MSYFARIALGLGLVFAGALTPSLAADQSRSIETTDNGDYYGFDLRTQQNVTIDDCKAICIGDKACKAFTYNKKKSWCFLKSDHGDVKKAAGSIAGVIVTATADEPSAEPDIGAPNALDFTANYDADAQTYRANLIAAAPKDQSAGTAKLVDAADAAMETGDPRSAYQGYGAAIGMTPDDSALWTKLSRAALATKPTDSEGSFLQQAAVSGALNGYLTSHTTSSRADALVALAVALEARGDSRPALNAYKASLEVLPSKTVEAAYKDLRARKGFRVTDYTVDTASQTPRICVLFSEILANSDLDFASFLLLDDKAPKSVAKEDQQLCIDGVDYGQRYKVTVRQGLPSSVDETIEAPVTLSVFVRDRDSFVRFDSNAFVLPGTARRGIPITSVNSSQATLNLYRVNDRSLSALLYGSQFLTQLDSYGVERIKTEIGEPVWTGDIQLANDLNKESVTSFPVDEALPKREPGVYVLTAKALGQKGNEWDPHATQWFVVSDIGLSTFAGTDGLTVFARSLGSAKPVEGVALKLLAKNNELLGEAVTDASGKAVFEPGRVRGTDGLAPAVLTADKGGDDFVFLDMAQAGFDLSDRGVTGRPAPGALDIYAYTERGVYRPGETVHAAALARDGAANAVDNLPLTFVFNRPDGVEDRRFVSSGEAAGGRSVDLALTDNAQLGTWTLQIFTDPKGTPIAEKTLLVENFIPDRTEFDLKQEGVDDEGNATISVAGRYLYGAPAAGLGLEGEMVLSPTRTWDKYPGYEFGFVDGDAEPEAPNKLELSELPILDDAGKANFPVSLADESGNGNLHSGKVTIRMRENGGRAVERSLDIAIPPVSDMIGIKQNFAGAQTSENSSASFKILSANAAGERTALAGLKWTLVKIDRNYQWYRDGSSWRYDPVNFSTKIANGVIDTKTDGEVEVSANVQWGHYRLEVESPDDAGPISSSDFYAGWYVESASTETPDGLEIALDKDGYKAGDTAKLKVTSRYAGEILITVGTEKLLATQTASVPAEGATIDIPVGADWGAGAYVTATLYRPGDTSDKHMPMRSIGLKWMGIDPADRKLSVAMDMVEKMEPRQKLVVPISVAGNGVSDGAWVMVSAVDVGILNLTNDKPADPDGWYFGQRQMGLEMRDIYGHLIDGSAGAFGKLHTGGDAPQAASQGSPPTEKLVAFFSGAVKLDASGKGTVEFDIPQFNGTARVNAVAWTKTGVGHMTKDVIIRDPLVMIASAPKFMAPDDVAELNLDIANTDGPAGDYKLELIPEGGIQIADGDIPTKVTLAAGQRMSLKIPVVAGEPGSGSLSAQISNGSGLNITNAVDIPVRSGVMPVTTRREIALKAKGGSVTIDKELFADSVLGDAFVSLSIARSSVFDIPALLMTLDRYPYGCAEQTTSRALPLLYVNELSKASGLPTDPDIALRINEAITRVLSYQSSTGSFGLWGPGSGDLWLDAYVTDFLTRAREQQFDVPEQAVVQALDNLQNSLSVDQDLKSQGNQIAYAVYVLARNRQASATDLRYYSESQIDQFASPMARAHLGAALALYGDQPRAEAAFASALTLAKSGSVLDLNRGDYGSELRDDAAMLALAAESTPAPASLAGMVEQVSSVRRKITYTTTQEDAWMLMAARALKSENAAISLNVNGEKHEGAFAQRLTGAEIEASGLTVSNEGSEALQAIVTSVAAPKQPLPAGGKGFKISRKYYLMDGTETTVTEAKQNDRFVVVLNVVEDNNWPSRLVVTDLLPAGLEIENPHMMTSADLANFDWLGETEVAHSEFRSDRFVAALDPSTSGARTLNLAYTVRAVTPGTYMLPAATVEDMYRPGYSARTSTGRMSVLNDK